MSKKEILYFVIGALTCFVTDTSIQQIANEPVLLEKQNWFCWLYLVSKCLLGGSVALKACLSRSPQDEAAAAEKETIA